MAGASAERQEQGVIDAITFAIKANGNNPVTVVAGRTTIAGVKKAFKYNGRQESGSEPYTDVVFELHNGKKINLSLKGESSPSLAGGGLNHGQVIGASDKDGAYVKERVVRPGDIAATLYRFFGIPLETQYLDSSGRPRTIIDQGQPIRELGL